VAHVDQGGEGWRGHWDADEDRTDDRL